MEVTTSEVQHDGGAWRHVSQRGVQSACSVLSREAHGPVGMLVSASLRARRCPRAAPTTVHPHAARRTSRYFTLHSTGQLLYDELVPSR